MSQYGFYFDQTRCTDCFTCAVACKDWHDLPAGSANWLRVQPIEKGEFPNPFVAYLFTPCYHCEKPACVDTGPAEALTKNPENGIVTANPEECLGADSCGSCKEACPYGAPQFEGNGDAMIQKCNLCLERLQEGQKPICVEACPLRALDAGPMDELRKKYGDKKEAEGFNYSVGLKPSIIFKPKRFSPPGGKKLK